MTLEYQIDSLDGLEENISSLYVEKDGRYTLDVQGHDKPDMNKIPKSRLDQEIAKRKTAEESLSTVADALKTGIPEAYQTLIPDMPPAAMIAWIQKMNQSGIFDTKETPPIDNKKPNDKKPTDLDGLSPQAMMSKGYKN